MTGPAWCDAVALGAGSGEVVGKHVGSLRPTGRHGRQGGMAWSLKGLPGDVGMGAEVPAKKKGGGEEAAAGAGVAMGVVEGVVAGRRKRRRSDARR